MFDQLFARYGEKDEEIRYDDLEMIHGGKAIFIRFNPDGGRGVDFEDMIERLLEEIEKQIERIENDENENLLEIVKLYYPQDGAGSAPPAHSE